MDYKRLKMACYSTNLSMSIVGNLSPLLFLTFRSLYGISYSLLGTLVLINFVTQLLVDLAFSFFSHRFNIPFAVKITPALSCAGLAVYAAAQVKRSKIKRVNSLFEEGNFTPEEIRDAVEKDRKEHGEQNKQ